VQDNKTAEVMICDTVTKVVSKLGSQADKVESSLTPEEKARAKEEEAAWQRRDEEEVTRPPYVLCLVHIDLMVTILLAHNMFVVLKCASAVLDSVSIPPSFNERSHGSFSIVVQSFARRVDVAQRCRNECTARSCPLFCPSISFLQTFLHWSKGPSPLLQESSVERGGGFSRDSLARLQKQISANLSTLS
jgi:hypothetical protein